MKKELVIVIDFGGQYNQLVARRVRECNVYCEIYSYKTDLAKIKAMNPKGIILTGGPNSCYKADSPTYQRELFELGIPVLGLCYGAQLMMHVLGGKVEKADVSEYGKTELLVDKKESRIFKGVSEKTIVWMSHTDYISKQAPGFEIAAHTADCPVAVAENEAQKLYAIQFHPEVLHTVEGKTMLSNFVLGVCECAGDWKMDAFVEHTIKEIREKVGDGKVLLALSGGVDSSVAAAVDRLSAHCLNDEEYQTAAVQCWQGKKVHNPKVCGQQGCHVQHIHPNCQHSLTLALLIGASDGIHNANRPAEILHPKTSCKKLLQAKQGGADQIFYFQSTVFQHAEALCLGIGKVVGKFQNRSAVLFRRYICSVFQAVSFIGDGHSLAGKRMICKIIGIILCILQAGAIDGSNHIPRLHTGF